VGLFVDTMGRRSRRGVMKASVLLLTLVSSVCLLNACGGSSASSGGARNTVATHFSVTAPATATGGSSFSFTVTALDAANNVATRYSGTVRFTSTDSQAVLPVNSTLTGGTGTTMPIDTWMKEI